MQYQVFGRDQQSGEPVEPFVVDAEDERDARNRASEMGTEVDRIVPVSSERIERARPRAPGLTVDQLVFVGLNGYALALDRDTGEIVWSNGEMHSGYVTLLLDGDRLIVSTNGYIYCLDPLTGRILWHNPLRGYGVGAPTSLISVRGHSSQTLIQQAAAETARSSSD